MDINEIRHTAWEKLTGKWKTFAIVTLIVALIFAVIEGGQYFTSRYYNFFVDLLDSILSLLSIIVSGPLFLSLAICGMKVYRGEDLDKNDAFLGFNDTGRAIALTLFNTLYILLWSLLLIVPGIIASIKYSMSYFILIDNPTMSQEEARRESMRIMEGHKMDYFILMLSFIGWFLLVILTLGILSFWVTPYVYTAQTEFYNRIKGDTFIKNEDPFTNAEFVDATTVNDNNESF